MPDRPAETLSTAPSGAAAERAVDRLQGMAADVRGCAVIASDGTALAATGERARWGEAAAGLLAAADAAAGEPATQVHVATEEGEAFAVRDGGYAIVAVAERFALASLMLTDMRAVLRDLARAAGSADAAAARTLAGEDG